MGWACDGTDYVTQDIAVELLADEEAHLCQFAGYRKNIGRK